MGLYIDRNRQGGGVGVKKRGPGWKNDVLITCKAIPLRGGQRIIAVTFPLVNAVS